MQVLTLLLAEKSIILCEQLDAVDTILTVIVLDCTLSLNEPACRQDDAGKLRDLCADSKVVGEVISSGGGVNFMAIFLT